MDQIDQTEVYSPVMEKGTVKKGYLYLHPEEVIPIEYTEIDGLAIYQGDIILGKADKMAELTKMVNSANDIEQYKGLTSNIITAPGEKWPGSQIAYELDNSVQGDPLILQLILDALVKISNSGLPIKIKRRTAVDKDYICFYKSTGCSSYVGMQGGMQPVNIADWAIYGNVIHEVCHAAGLWHEHSRKDRAAYINLNFSNIKPEAKHNFDMTQAEGQDSGVYDYDSIMHYGAYAFAIDRSHPTITPVQSARIGQRDHLSAGDTAGLKVLYPAPPIP
jgi:astacin